jgi:transposase-like protein
MYQINLNPEDLHHLLGQNGGITKLVEQALNQILLAQSTEHLQADPYERTEERQGYRNGFYSRKLTTRVGTITLRVPRTREGRFSTELFERYQRSEQALVLSLMEMVVNGVSTRKISQITEELCGTGFSKSAVSDLCKRLDPIVQGWNNRNLRENRYPFLLVDAMIVKVREEGRVRSRSIMIATGVNEEGYREILGLMLGDSESEASWTEFFSWLKSRDLRGVDLVVSDHHSGLVKAVQTQFQGCSWQRCQTHFMRNVLDATPKALQSEMYAQVRSLLDAQDCETARMLLNRVLEDYSDQAPKAMKILEEGFEDVAAVLALPVYYRKRLRTTNGVERLNEEVRRRERVIRIFPNRESVVRLVGAVLMEMDEKWSTGKRYFDMTEYLVWKQEQASSKLEKIHHLAP